MTGTFNKSARFGSTTLQSRGGGDIFIAKMDREGNFIWAKQAGSSVADNFFDDDIGQAIAVEPDGSFYLGGIFVGTAKFDDLSLSVTLSGPGFPDVFVARYTSDGNVVWVRQVGDFDIESLTGIAIDKSGGCFITGNFDHTIRFGDIRLDGGLGQDAIFIARFNANGELLWATGAGGDNSDLVNGIVVDNEHNCYIAGTMESTATFGTTTLTSIGYRNIFLAKITSPVGSASHYISTNDALIVYPNPTADNPLVHISSGPGSTHITLTDMLGRVVLSE